MAIALYGQSPVYSLGDIFRNSYRRVGPLRSGSGSDEFEDTGLIPENISHRLDRNGPSFGEFLRREMFCCNVRHETNLST